MGETPKKRRLSETDLAVGETQTETQSQSQVPSMDSPTKKEQKPRRTLFVRSLPASATTDSLTEYFSQSYVIKHALVVSDKETKQSKGYGFVTFADLEDAQSALEEFNGSVLDGKKIKVDYAEPRHREIDDKVGKSVQSAVGMKVKEERLKEREKENEKGKEVPPRLIVRNLPWSIKESEDLANLFRSYGKVKQAIVPKKGAKLAGFGFVVLRGRKNAEKALEGVNGKEVDGRTLAVDWAVDKETWETVQKSAAEANGEHNADENAEPEDEADGSAMGDVDMLDVDDEVSEDSSDEEDDEEDLDDLDDDDSEEEKEDERNASTIFIRNLPFTCTDEILYEHFTQFGSLRYARCVLDPETERPRGTGFVCFWKPEDAISCLRDAPARTEAAATEKEKSGKNAIAIKKSVLQNETADPSGRYTIDGRVLQVARAVSKSTAAKLEEEGVSRRLVRDKDKRRLYLLSEGTIPSNSPLYKKLSPTEIKMREDSFKQRQTFIKKNPALHLSLTRLAIRNVPRHVTSKDLKALAREAVVGFAKDAKNGLRQPLSREENQRCADIMKEADQHRKEKKKGIVKQAKIVFEGRDGGKVGETSGAGRSRGYGFIEYYTHRHALMGLRWLNGHAVLPPSPVNNNNKNNKGKSVVDVKEKERTKRLIVEFAIENAQVVKRRAEREEKTREGGGPRHGHADHDGQDRGAGGAARGQKRKRFESLGNGSRDDRGGRQRGRGREHEGGREGGQEHEEAGDEDKNKLAKRNRIIAKKRMQRRVRKGRS